MKMQVITESELLEKLKQNLPTLPNIAHKILHIVQSPKSSVQDISKVVKVDQSLVSKVLFAVQALGFFSFFSQPVLPPQVKKIINIKNLKIEPILRQMNKELAMNAKLFDSPYADSEIFKESLQKINLRLGLLNSNFNEKTLELEKHISELNTVNTIIGKIRKMLDYSQIIQNILPLILHFAVVWFKFTN